MPRNITVIFPTNIEAAPFMARYGNLCNTTISGIGYGECSVATIKEAINGKSDIIILAGIAGAYRSSKLEICDVVNVTRENLADLGTMRRDKFTPLAQGGSSPADNYYTNPTILPDTLPLAVSNSVVTAGTENISSHFRDADIENMEGAAFFAVCRALGTQFAEIRSISNYVGDNRQGWHITEAAESLAESLANFIKEIQEQ